MADIKNSTPTVAAVAMSAPDIELQEPTFNVPKAKTTMEVFVLINDVISLFVDLFLKY